MATRMQKETFVRILTTISFLLSAGASVIAYRVPPAVTYELSIFDAYPWTFWGCLWLAISTGILAQVLLWSIGKRTHRTTQLISLVAVVMCNCVVIALPIFRGYYFYGRADPLTHLGEIQFIQRTGYLGRENFYPANHLLIVAIGFLTGLDVRAVMLLSPVLFYLVYMAGMYLWASGAGNNPRARTLIMVFASPLLFTYFHSFFFPTQFALSLAPLLLAIYERRIQVRHRMLEFRVLFVLLLFILPYVHPLGSFLFLIIFLLREVSRVIFTRLNARLKSSDENPQTRGKANLTPFLFLLVTFLTWFFSFEVFNRSLTKMRDWFLYDLGTAPVEEIATALGRADISLGDFLELLVRLNGHHILYSVVSGVAIMFVLKGALSSSRQIREQSIFLTLGFTSLVIIFVSSLVADITLTGANVRLLTWALIFSVVLNGLILSSWLYKPPRREASSFARKSELFFNMRLYILASVVVCSAIIGMYNVHDSPEIQRANKQVTLRDIHGMAWLYKNGNLVSPVFFLSELPYRSIPAIAGSGLGESLESFRFTRAPKHFSYDHAASIGDSLIEDAYIVINGYNKAMYKELWPDIGYVTSEDLDRLEFDPSLNKVYSNGELDVWLGQPR